jgi:adenosine deaminase
MHLRPESYYQSLPKVDLHRHLEGSLRLGTLYDIASEFDLDLPGGDGLRPLVQVVPADPLTSHNFLSKFDVLRRFYRSPQVIARITEETIADAAADNVRYLEIRFTPAALSKVQGFPLGEVMDWVAASAEQAQSEFGVTTRLIASLNRHESPRIAELVASLAVERREKGIVGLDLAGDEGGYSTAPFIPIFQEARQAGLNITVHAGEWGGANNVAEAIQVLGADRIGHGVRVMEDPSAISLGRERGIPFEVCVTSNVQSGVVVALQDHPIQQMLEAGLNVTIDTDDPSISQITLSDEYRIVCEQLGFTTAVLQDRILAAARAAFLSAVECEALVSKLAAQLQSIGDQGNHEEL